MDLVHEADQFLLHALLLRLLSLLGLLEGIDQRAVLSPHLFHKPHEILTHTLWGRERGSGERERIVNGRVIP